MSEKNQNSRSWTPEQLLGHIKEVCGSIVTEKLDALQKTVTDHGTWITSQNKNANNGGMGDAAYQRTFEQKGLVVGGIIAAAAAHKVLGCSPLEWAKGTIKDQHGNLIKAQSMDVIKALEASSVGGGGILITPEYSEDFIDLLTPRAVLRSFGVPVVPMTSGTMNMSKLNSSASAYYVGENKDMVKSQQSFGAKKLTARKLAALVPVSNDLIKRGGPKVNQIVRNDTLRAVALKEDVTFIRAVGTEYTPKGLRYLAAAGNILTQSGGSSYTLDTVTFDLGQMLLALENNDVPFTNPGWIFAPRTAMYLMTVRDGNGNYAFRSEMLTGKLWGYPFKKTTQIPINLGSGNKSEIYVADFDDVLIGQVFGIEVAISTEASYKDENGDLVSAFSLDQSVMRVITEHDIILRHDESVAVMTEVEWQPTA